MWKNTNFSVKVIALVCVLTLFAALTAVGYHSMSNQIRDIGIESAGDEMLSGYKNELKDIVDVMALTLAAATEGETDTNKVHETYSTLARGARFFHDKSGYFFVFENGVTVLHAAQPDLEGKDLIDLQDVNKVYVIKELDEIAKAGGGYLEYHWDKPGKGNNQNYRIQE